jgi:predicted nucleic acid-binding protein
MPDPSGRICICNTSPLFYLHQVKRLPLLKDLYDGIVTTPEVQEELAAGAVGGEDVPDLRGYDWIRIQPVAIPSYLDLITDLGRGEASVLALGLETRRTSLVVIDDKLGRQIARLRGLAVTGTAGVLLKAKQLGKITAVRPILNDMVLAGFRLHPDVVADILGLAGET